MGCLDRHLAPEELGDLSLLEAASTAPLSNAKRRPGESLHSWGERLKAGDKANEKAAKKTTRGGKDVDFEKKHPRTRGGKWTFKSGAAGSEVRGIQRRIGAKVDGKFGQMTRAAVMRFQRRHGLQVDGVVGRQTVAAMRGRKGTVKPGAMTATDRRWLAGHRANRGR